MEARVQLFRRFIPRPPAARAERLSVTTADGVDLVLWRVPPVGESQGPLLLVHGLAGNVLAFHYPERSLANFLSQQGFDCYVAELRGFGESKARPEQCTLHAHVAFDVPALVEGVLAHSRFERLGWVAHSMGGVVMMCHGIRTKDPRLHAGVALGAALDYRLGTSAFSPVLPFSRLFQRPFWVPLGVLLHHLSPLAGKVPGSLGAVTHWPKNLEPHHARVMQAHGFENVPSTLLSTLAELFSPKGPACEETGLDYRAAAARYPSPLWLVSASKDLQCPPESVAATAALFDPSRSTLSPFGRRFGHAEEYGHLDLLLGRHAPTEVWPRVAEWLGGTAGARRSSALGRS